MWNREKFIEYRKLKRSGYTDQQLKEHFGDDIYESGIYNKGTLLLGFIPFINEIKISPTKIDYIITVNNSIYQRHGKDYIIEFESKGIKYILALFLFEVNNIPTYNITFTTKEQYIIFKNKFNVFIKKGVITEAEQDELKNIFESKTNYFDLFNVMRYISYIILDINFKLPENTIFSIGHTDIETKINLYRSIIKDSFKDINEEVVYDSSKNKYYLYKRLSK